MKNLNLNRVGVVTVVGVLVSMSAASGEPVNMLSLQEGAHAVVMPPTYGNWPVVNVLDDSPQTGWACESGHIQDNASVFELVEKTTLDRFEFDNASVDAEGAGARGISVEVSVTSPEEGFTLVLQATLADKTDQQEFPVTKKTPARWVRLTILTNQGNPEWTELFSFRGFGEKPAPSTQADISGTFESSYAKFHVRQQGTALVGCYEHDGGLLDGTIDGRVMKITWREAGGPEDHGLAVMVFSPDGGSFRGYWWSRGGEKGAPSGTWDGERISADVGGCPHWSGSVGGELKKQLSAEGRARLYGILFDFNSAVIRPESKPVIDEVQSLLRTEPSWKLTIEGHTDAVGPEARNLALSLERADSVRAYLVARGVDAIRIKTAGFGESKPVADNGTELGRAQNRRVELVRE